MTIRPVIQSDFDDIYTLYMDQSINPYLLHEIMNRESFKKIFTTLLSRDAFWVYEDRDEVIGMCACDYGTARTSHVASLGTFAVKPSHQGKGHAQIFLEKIINTLTEKGFHRIELWAEADNLKALKFYKKMGFEVDGRVPKYYKRANSDTYIDELILSKWFD